MKILGKQFFGSRLFFLLLCLVVVVWGPFAITDIDILHFTSISMNLTHI